MDPGRLSDALMALKEYGAPGIALMAFVINLIPGFPALYLLVIASMALAVNDPYYDAMLVLAGGIGSGLGKVTLFTAARVFGGRIVGEESARRAKYLVEHAGRSLFVLVFLFALLPLPDDSLYLPLGSAGYKLTLFTPAVIAGKTLMTLSVVVASRAARSYVDLIAGSASTSPAALAAGILGMVALMVFMFALIYKVDWPRVAQAYAERGWVAGTRVLLEEIAGIVSRGLSLIGGALGHRNRDRGHGG